MTEQNRKFLQETAFEVDENQEIRQDDYWQSDESKKRVAQKFQQWMKTQQNWE